VAFDLGSCAAAGLQDEAAAYAMQLEDQQEEVEAASIAATSASQVGNHPPILAWLVM
jgi:hypothetical protein